MTGYVIRSVHHQMPDTYTLADEDHDALQVQIPVQKFTR